MIEETILLWFYHTLTHDTVFELHSKLDPLTVVLPKIGICFTRKLKLKEQKLVFVLK